MNKHSMLCFTVGLSAVVVLLSSCAHLGLMGFTGDKDKYEMAFDEIQVASKQASQKLIASHPGIPDERIQGIAKAHFDAAYRAVRAVVDARERNVTPQTVGELLVSYSKVLQPTMTVVIGPQAFAVAFPNASVVVSETLVGTFSPPVGELDEALFGIFVHELIHVYDAHSVLQWMTADSRKAVVANQVATVSSSLASFFFSFPIRYNADDDANFRVAAEFPQLSEHAADLATVGILKLYGIDSAPYTKYLRMASSGSTHTTKEPFSWVEKRLACIEALTSASPPAIKTLVVSESGKAAYTFDAIELASKDKPFDSDRRTLTFKQIAYFLMCAADKSFENPVRRENGMIIVPFFEADTLFFHY